MIHPAMSFRDYLDHPAWGSSSLKAMRKGPPARVLWERANPSEDTDDTRRGTAVHSAFLTPEEFAATYVQKPEDMNFSTVAGKEWKKAHAEKAILSFPEYALVRSITAALRSKPLAATSLCIASHVEASMFWTDEATEEECKGRPDWVDCDAVYDLKVSRHAMRPASLAYHAYAEGWMHQLAHNRSGCNANGIDVVCGRLVVVAPKAPHYVWCLEVKVDSLDLLHLDNIETLRALRACRTGGSWPDSPDAWQYVEPPPAALVEVGAATFETEE